MNKAKLVLGVLDASSRAAEAVETIDDVLGTEVTRQGAN
jgi:hypothetical protein